MKSVNRTISTIIVFFVSLVIYFMTTSPDLSFTDSGELAAVCCKLGIAHPSGYPLFSMLGYLWTLLPLPFTKIYSLNLFASFLTAASAGVFFNLNYSLIKYLNNLLPEKKGQSKKLKLHDSKHSKPAINQINESSIAILSLIVAFIFAFSSTVWSQAEAIEVYPLQVFIICLVLYTFVEAMTLQHGTKEMKLMTAAFLLGLGFTNHLTTMLLILPVIFLYFIPPKTNAEPVNNKFKFLFILFIPFFLALSLYIYMPLRSAALPDLNWGWVHRSFQKFLYHVQGKQYQVWMFSGLATIKQNFSKFLELIPYQLGWVGIATLLTGLWYGYKLSKPIFWFLIILITSCLLYTLNYSIHDIDTYFIQAFIGIILFSGIGIFFIIRKFQKILIVFFIIPVLCIMMNFTENNNSKNYLVPEYTRIMIDNLEPNAIIISSQWDYFCSAFWYKQRVEGYRADVTLIEQELLRRTWYINQFRVWYPQVYDSSRSEVDLFMQDLEIFESGGNYNPASIQSRYVAMLNSFIDKNYNKRPIYVTLDIIDKEPDVARNYFKAPIGFAFRLYKNTTISKINIDNINIDKFLLSSRGKTDHLSIGIVEIASVNLANMGRYALNSGQRKEAEEAFRLAIRANPNNNTAAEGLRLLNK
jgi:hypothetical protein